MVYKNCKIDFSGYKEATLSRRVERRMAANRLNNLASYFDFCSKNPDELNKLSKDILISVTAFFRDRNSFEGLRKTLAGIIAEKQPGDEIRIWVPACATGEEAYSIGILLSDLLGAKMNDYRIQIFATDIDMDAMAVARKGIYTDSSLAEVSADTITRYFSKKAEHYEIARTIRDMVVFARHLFPTAAANSGAIHFSLRAEAIGIFVSREIRKHRASGKSVPACQQRGAHISTGRLEGPDDPHSPVL
jgi:two-component system CheB/CheR fusion protein